MPFCPMCRSEFEPGAGKCAECNAMLVERLDEEPKTDVEFADVYVCFDAAHAERTVELLRDKGVEVLMRDRTSTAFPLTVGETAERILAVPVGQRVYARSVIEAAVGDGVIPSDGKLLPY